MSNKIPLCLTFDASFAMSAGTCITSILENKHKKTQLDVFLLHSSVPQSMLSSIVDLEKHYSGCNINPIDMGNLYHELPGNQRWKAAAFYRFAIPNLLKDYDKAIYLDTDILCFGDLAEYYAQDINNYYLGGVRSAFNFNIALGIRPRFGREFISHVINSGSLLLNLTNMRRDRITEQLVQTTLEERDSELYYFDTPGGRSSYFGDQCIFNLVCQGNIKYLPLKFNTFLQQDGNIRKYVLPYLFSPEEIETAYSKPYLVHFLTPQKPWEKIVPSCWNEKTIKYKRKWDEIQSLFNKYSSKSLQNLPKNLLLDSAFHVKPMLNDNTRAIRPTLSERELKLFDLSVLNNKGGSFKEYILENPMKPIIAKLLKELDEESIKVINRKIYDFCNWPDRSTTNHIKGLGLKSFLSDEEINLYNRFHEHLPALREEFPFVAHRTYCPDIFTYHHGLTLLPSNVLHYIRLKDFFDVGAFAGESSSVFKEYEPKHLHLFEASKKKLHEIKDNMRLNRIGTDMYSIYPVLAGNDQGIVQLEDKEAVIAGKVENFKCIMVTLDAFTTNFPKLSLGVLKIAIEGAEFDTVLGGIGLIQKHRPILLIAIYHNPLQFFELKPYLFDMLPDYTFIIRDLSFIEIHRGTTLIGFPNESI